MRLAGSYVTIDGLWIYYETVGKGRPIILIHTAGTDSRIWRDFMLEFPMGSEFELVALDLPGHGKSDPWPNWRRRRFSISDYAGVVIKFIDALGVREEPIIMGCSIGGDIALKVAIELGKAGREGLVFPINAAMNTRTFSEDQIRNADPTDIEPTLNYCGRRCTKEVLEKIAWIKSTNRREVYINDLYAWNEFDVTSELDELSAQVTLIRGQDDPLVTRDMATSTCSRIRRCVYVELPSVGHYPMIENPGELIKALREHHPFRTIK